MGLQPGSTAAPGLNNSQRCYLLGQTSDSNIFSWLLKQVLAYTQNNNETNNDIQTQLPTISSPPAFSQPSSNLIVAPNPILPYPTKWKPLHNPSEWIYTDGSLKAGKPRLGASVIHSPTSTTTYIDASGQDETHTIMRAELVAIYVALDKYKDDKWLGIFTDSQTSLHAIQNQLQRPSHSAYHHHKPLLTAIVTLIRYRDGLNLPTHLRKIRGHTNIRGNDLADTAAKLVVTSFAEIPTHKKIIVTIGKQAEIPPYWVMYTNNPIIPSLPLSTGPLSSTLRQPWWTIPETDRLCMHAFTKISNQLRLKVRNATLRSLHHTSLYKRLILKAKAKGARTNTVGAAIHSLIRKSPKDGITLLKFVHGQLYNGKLAYRYKLAPTDTCPLCGMPDSCTNLAGECNIYNNQFISRHNAACQLTHAAIRTASKGGGTIYSPHDLTLISMDSGTKLQTTDEDIDDLNISSSHTQLEQPSPPSCNT